MPVVANINADPGKGGIEAGVAEISRPKIELLPEARSYVGDMRFSILAEVFAVGVDNCGRIVINAGLLFLVDWHDQNHAVLFRHVLHKLDRRTVRDLFDSLVPTRLLFGAEVRRGKDLLEAKHLHTLPRSVLDQLHLVVYICLPNFRYRSIGRCHIVCLDKAAFDYSCHNYSLVVFELNKASSIGTLVLTL